MGQLRQKMLSDRKLHGYSHKTISDYLRCGHKLAEYAEYAEYKDVYGDSPPKLATFFTAP